MAGHQVNIDRERCKGCGLCVHFCRYGALAAAKEPNSFGYFPACCTDAGKCRGCTHCYLVCPDMAIEISRDEE